MSSAIDIDLASIQSYLTELIAKNLEINPANLDLEQPLLEFGADSIVMVNTLATIKDRYDISLRMLQLFEEIPDIRSIAAYVYENLCQQTAV